MATQSTEACQRIFWLSAVVLCASMVSVAFGDHMAIRAGIEFITVGDVGNSQDVAYYHSSRNPLSVRFGGVDYQYAIGKYEVTAVQYTAFLNEVAASDPNSLYNANMATGTGCGITRSGESGSYVYSIDQQHADRPVNYVSTYDAFRFCNWLTTGDTETGVYDLSAGTMLTRQESQAAYGVAYFLPNEDEWYKAAYYDANTASYSLYATGADTIDTTDANYDNLVGDLTSVGSYNSTSHYGVYDMAGNVLEWIDSPWTDASGTDWTRRMIRGGAFTSSGEYSLAASFRTDVSMTGEYAHLGFRIAAVPEPGSLGLLTVAGVSLLVRQRRSRIGG